ncbi:MAG: TolB family protein [Candidatus Thorarchaeota archaeon]
MTEIVGWSNIHLSRGELRLRGHPESAVRNYPVFRFRLGKLQSDCKARKGGIVVRRLSRASIAGKIAVLVALITFQSCGKPAVVKVPLVQVRPERTKETTEMSVVKVQTRAYLEVIERSPNVSTVTRITENEKEDVVLSDPVLSPDGSEIAYTVLTGRPGESIQSNIWKQLVGSKKRTRLTFGRWVDLHPWFSPDGRYVYFSSNRDGRSLSLWRISSEGGGGLTKITSSEADDYRPCISSDGEVIVYESLPSLSPFLAAGNEPQIWTVQPDGKLPTQLREGECPRISPDGNWIVFVRTARESGRKQIWLMGVDGSSETQLTNNSDYDAIDPQWSPDGNWIAFASDEGLDSRGKHNFDIWIMKSDGTQKTQLTTNGSRDDSPCWDRTQDYIYFRSNRGGKWNIWRLKVTWADQIVK